MTRGLLSIIISFMIGGGVGFLTAVYVVPPDEAVQFRKLVDAAIGLSSSDDKAVAPGATQATPEAPSSPQGRAEAVCAPDDTDCGAQRPAGAAAPAPKEEPAAKVETAPTSAERTSKAHVAPGGHSKHSDKRPASKTPPPPRPAN